MRKLKFAEIRNLFFEEFTQFKHEQRSRKKHDFYSCDCRCYFIDFCESLYKDGQITERQNNNITLG